MNATSLSRRFSLERTALVLRNRLLEELPTLAIAVGIVVAINLLTLIVAKTAIFNQGRGMAWTLVIVFGGWLASTLAFKGMHDGKAGTDWLLLPATPCEKYTAAVVEYLVVLPVAGSLVFMALSALLELVQHLIGGRVGQIWTPTAMTGGEGGILGTLDAWLQYSIGAAVFLAGSASFRKAAFLKTLGMAAAYGLAMAILLFGVAWLVYKGHGFNASQVNFTDGNFSINGSEIPATVGRVLTGIWKLARDILLPVFALLYGYFRVYEKEARDEVQ